MSEAGEAYKAAVRLIANAKKDGADRLSFDTDATRALTALPPEIATLHKLRCLDLDHTGVTDLTPLAGMVGMTWLSLNNTQITDLAPLVRMAGMTELSLNDTRIGDLTPLAGMLRMTVLSLNDSRFGDLTPLAKMVGMTRLSFAITKITDLTPLAGMVGMTELDLNFTRVTDLTPLSGMREMTTLNLNYTPVTDMRPLLGMTKLVERPKLDGLTIGECQATRDDSRIDQIAGMTAAGPRAAALFEFLKDWVPPGEEVPETDDLLPVLLTDGRLDIARSLPSEAEIDDRLKRALHDRLRLKADELARVPGNTQGRLAGRARSLASGLDCPFDELDMINIHMDVEDLSTSLRTNPDRLGEDRYSPDILDALTDVTSIGPGLTLDNLDVQKLEDRKRRFAQDPPGPEVMAAHNEFSRAVAADMAAIGDNLRALEARIVEREGEPSSGAIQVSTHRDMFIRIGRWGLVGAGTLITGAAGNGLWQFVYDNRDLIMVLANSYGAGFAQWFGGMIAQVSDVAGLAAHVEARPIERKRDRRQK